ncbi:ground-like domain protein [Ancylostoma caninum]|uniref:Ground-like domain protein n=1 Tax=Ancylostoma caninum TaxID=29170 RepID=A0A368GXW7_ANCCA|nr:ground-like domain protein [Ancylostoma caninum]
MYPTYSYRVPYPAYNSYAAIAEPQPLPVAGGCGGAPAVAPVPLPRPPAQNDCCCGCSSPCKYKRRAAAYGNKTAVDPSCNNEALRSLIQEFITSDATSSKREIQKEAEEKLGVAVNVICGKGEFSYVAHTESFCQSSKDEITCYAFQPL